MKRVFLACLLSAASILYVHADIVFVLEPQVEMGLGGQFYSVPGFTAEGIDGFAMTGQYVPGLRLSFYDYGPGSLDFGACFTFAYSFANLGAYDYDNDLGASYSLQNLKFGAMVCIPFFKEDTGIMGCNVGVYYAQTVAGTYYTGYETDIETADFSGDFGLRAELVLLAAFAYYEDYKPALGGMSVTLYLEVNVTDMLVSSDESLNYWVIGFGFGVPFYF